MFNLDPGKLIVIAVVAIILLGPDKLPQVARQVGAAWRSFGEFRHRMESEVRSTLPDLPSTSEIARAIAEPRQIQLDTTITAHPVVHGSALHLRRVVLNLAENAIRYSPPASVVRLSVAAASIVAKVTRDRLMTRLGLAHPGYGFERHMGYSVPEHFAALAKLGPTIHHRKSFAPVAAKLAALGGASDEVIAELLPL